MVWRGAEQARQKKREFRRVLYVVYRDFFYKLNLKKIQVRNPRFQKPSKNFGVYPFLL